MGNQIVISVFFLIAFILLLTFNEMMYRRLGLKGEITRKFAHFSATLSTIAFPFLFTDHWYVLALAVFFFILLFFSRNKTALKSIHDIDRKSVGSYMLPVAIYLTFLIYIEFGEGQKIIFVLPMLILAISDPAAGILGLNLQRYNHNIELPGFQSKKTWLGSGSFFVSSLIISLFALYFYRTVFDLKTFWLALGIALVSTITELFSWRGIDNLSIPVSVLIMLFLFL